MKTNNIGFKQEYEHASLTLAQINLLVGDALLEFGAPWCEHCQAARPAIQEVMAENSALSHIKIYDGKGKQLGRAFRVKLWPTLILLHNGQEVARLVRPLIADEVRKLIMK